MIDLQVQFQEATEKAKKLSTRPNNETMLKLYSLFKQGTTGNVTGKRPGFTDFVGRAKYDAWAKLKGTGQAEAQQAYINLVDELSGTGPAGGSAGFGD